MLLEYTELCFEIVCEDYPSFNSWVHHSSGPLVGGGQWQRWMDSAAAMKGGGQGAAGAGETGELWALGCHDSINSNRLIEE